MKGDKTNIGTYYKTSKWAQNFLEHFIDSNYSIIFSIDNYFALRCVYYGIFIFTRIEINKLLVSVGIVEK